MEVTHTQLVKAIRKSYATKRPLMISGTTGIGKSWNALDTASKIAKQESRQVCEWNRISDKEKLAIFENKAKRESVFLYIDLRTSQLDPSDLRGLPKLNGREYVEWKPNMLFALLALDGVKGILFFDELNLAPPSVQAAAYQIILDKCIGEIAINPDICIIGAGNRLEDHANVFEMAAPLQNRFTHVTLGIPTIKEWIDWAMEHKVDDRILAYLQFKPSHLMADLSKVKNFKSAAFATPRSWQFCSDLIAGEKDLDDLQMYASACVSDGVAIEFCAWLKLSEKIDLDKILNHPEMAKGLEIDIRWSLISAISERYRADKKILDKALNICNYMEPDFSASMLRMLKRQNEAHFTTNVVKCANWKQIAEKYGKYISSRGE